MTAVFEALSELVIKLPPHSPFPTAYLQVKNHLLLEYNTAVALVCLIKLEGGELEGHPVVDHLTFLRTALDKLKPVETKIKYQIDKLLRADTAEGKGKGKADPLKFKPNLGNLQAKVCVSPGVRKTYSRKRTLSAAASHSPLSLWLQLYHPSAPSRCTGWRRRAGGFERPR